MWLSGPWPIENETRAIQIGRKKEATALSLPAVGQRYKGRQHKKKMGKEKIRCFLKIFFQSLSVIFTQEQIGIFS